MKGLPSHIILLIILTLLSSCEKEKETLDYSGIYCLNIQNIEMTIVHTNSGITFTLENDLLVNGTGTLSGDTLVLTAQTSDAELFISNLIFADDMQSFSGPYQISDINNNIKSSGVLLGIKGSCSKFDIESNGIPKFIGDDFTQLSRIEKISKFRSGFGHSSTDGTEECRSMKHYYTPYSNYRENNTVEIYAPVTGRIVSVSNDGHGTSMGLKNKEIQLMPDDQPAFIIVIYHCDLISPAIATGKDIQAGELLGHASLYDEELDQYSTSFDIALWVNTPQGARLISYFEAMTDDLFNHYISRGADSRQDFIIPREERDADPLLCDGETFLTEGNLENWVTLSN
jgi:hypothetical protein